MEHTEDITQEAESAKALTAAYLERGKACFGTGKYKEAIDNLTKCLPYRHDRSCGANVVHAYIQMGLIYCLLGYEIAAVENFMLGQEYAKRRKEHGLASDCFLHISWMYRMLGDYVKAIDNCSHSEIEAEQTVGEARFCRIKQAKICKAQILCLQAEYEGALKIQEEIGKLETEMVGCHETEVAYGCSLNETALHVMLEDYLHHEKEMKQELDEFLEMAWKERDFVRHYTSYLEICRLALDRGKQRQCRELLDCLHERAHETGVLYIRLKIQAFEVEYRRKFCTRTVYYQACLEYFLMQQKNQADAKEMKRGSLENIERLWEEKEEERLFEYQSKCDLMTGLLNKNAAEEEIRQYLNNRSEYSLDAMIIVDIDYFKMVNDTYGHMMGDKVLVTLARLMKEIFSGSQILGRFGGDEFLVFVKNAESKEALEEKIYRLKEEFAAQTYPNVDAKVTLSIGTSYITDMTVSYEAIFGCADEALYKAKEYGRDIAVFYEISESKTYHKNY